MPGRPQPSLASSRPGLFVTFEGGEGAGKSTQIARLATQLSELGHDVVVTREPGGSPRAEALRRILLRGDIAPFGTFAEAAIFAAARADHVDTTIRPALERGAIVLCDRFVDSTRVYQGALAGISERVLGALEAASIGRAVPQLTLVLDLPAELGLSRAAARRHVSGETADRFESEGVSYHQRIQEAFRAIAQAEPDRCVLIDAAKEPDVVASAIWSAVEERLAGSLYHGVP